jgi:hypothetical protein
MARKMTSELETQSHESCQMCGAVLLSIVAHGQSTRIAPAPREAVAAVLDLFERYSIVALSEGPHNNQKEHDFRRWCVILASAGSSTASWSNSAAPGADVPYRPLPRVWENTTTPGTLWDSPIN